MTKGAPLPADVPGLLPSWELHLRAERKSPQTIKSYTDGVRRYLDFCEREGAAPELDRDSVRAFVADLLDSGAAAATAASRLLALKRYAAWMVEEGELDSSDIEGLKTPKIDRKVVQPLTEDELKALLAACRGREFRDRRDEAILRLMIDTGMRAGEVVALGCDDINPDKRRAVVRRGKGGRGRIVPFKGSTALAIDRYVRARRGHRLADTGALWLGDRGKGLTYYGLHAALKARAGAAGIDRFHPHLLRHTAAQRWLAAGGTEGGLMAVAGWNSTDMLMRYTQAEAASRALDEFDRLGLGDL